MRPRHLQHWAVRTRSAHEKAQCPAPTGRVKTPEERMNKGEQAYAIVLDQRMADGHVAAWYYEPLNWRLADNTFYRGDFLVLLTSGALELHEVKGRKGDSFYAEEDAWLKLKTVADQMPWPVVVVWPLKGNVGWGEKRL